LWRPPAQLVIIIIIVKTSPLCLCNRHEIYFTNDKMNKFIVIYIHMNKVRLAPGFYRRFSVSFYTTSFYGYLTMHQLKAAF